MVTDFGGIYGNDPDLLAGLGVDVNVVADPRSELPVLPPSSGEEDGSVGPLRHAGIVVRARLRDVYGGSSALASCAIRGDGATPSSRCSSVRYR